MKILAPVSVLGELEPLIRSGAEEFYCGVTPPDWLMVMGPTIWMNRRHPLGANLPSLEDLKELVAHAHAVHSPVFLTCNAPTYSGSALRYVVELARVCVADAGIDAVIVSDMELLLALRERVPSAAVHLSSLASCFNAAAARFYRALGVKRIILPRQLRLSEIQALVAAVPDMEFEVFGLNDGCWFEEGFCNTTHALGPFCLTEWRYDFLQTPTEGGGMQWEHHWQDFREFLWYTNNCGSSMSARGLPQGPCGLCALADLHRIGIKSVKIVGREGSLQRKVASVQLVNAVMQRVRRGISARDCGRYAVQLRSTPDLCASGYMCYYREACGLRV